MIALDASILSLAFRRRQQQASIPTRETLARLVADDTPIFVPGIALQEVLSGVREDAQFARLERTLESYPVALATYGDHAAAARIFNACRRSGISASAPDCLIAAMTIARGAALFTTDPDFAKMAPRCGLLLYRVPPA